MRVNLPSRNIKSSTNAFTDRSTDPCLCRTPSATPCSNETVIIRLAISTTSSKTRVEKPNSRVESDFGVRNPNAACLKTYINNIRNIVPGYKLLIHPPLVSARTKGHTAPHSLYSTFYQTTCDIDFNRTSCLYVHVLYSVCYKSRRHVSDI